jgi:hypothetical protein
MNRKTAKSSFVDKPHIPVLGGIQPTIFDAFNTEENKENGFTDRMLISFPDLFVESYNENEMDVSTSVWYDAYIVKFFEEVKMKWVKYNMEDDIEPLVVVMSKASKQQWTRIFNQITEMQNSDAENEYMKSMLPKQKSYIPRFAMLINSLWAYDQPGEYFYGTLMEPSMLRAEKLSHYFINMSKKVKIESAEKRELKDVIKNDPGKSKFALNLCNGETCYNDIQCTSGNCFEPGDIDQGLCMPVLQWWHILLIVLGGILLLALLILLICCCCRRQRASRLSRKLETHNHYYQQVPPNANTAYK